MSQKKNPRQFKIADPIRKVEVVNVMVDGGEQLCDYALRKWINNDYQCSSDTRAEHIQRWNLIKKEVRNFGNLLRKLIAEEL